MRKSKGIIALAAAVTMLLTAIQPVGFAADDPVSIVIPGKSATAVEYTYDGETYRNDNNKYVQWANDKTYGETNMHISSRISPLPDGNYQADVTKFSDGITLEYTVNIEEAGVYQLDIKGSDVTFVYRSPYAVAMDNKDFKSISVLTATEVIEEPADGNFSQHGLYVTYKTPLKYDLAAGEHTLRVNITGDAPNPDKQQYDAYIDTITLNRTEDTEVKDIYVYGLDPVSSVTEGFMAIQDTNAAKDGGVQTGAARMLRTPNDVWDEAGYVVSWPFEVQEAGAYRVTDLSIGDQDAAWLSKVALSVDDAPFTTITEMLFKKAVSYRDEAAFGDRFTTLFEKADHLRQTDINKGYWLTEGTHYLNLWVYTARNEGDARTWFDHIKLTRADIGEDGSFSIYGTDDSINNFESLSAEYAGKITRQLTSYGTANENNPVKDDSRNVTIWGPTIDGSNGQALEPPIQLDYFFYCPADGWYSLDLIQSNNSSWFSSVAYGIDGTDYKGMRQGDDSVVNSKEQIDERYAIDTKHQYYITEGEHTLNYRILDVPQSRNRVLTAFTEAKFTPVAESELPTSIRVGGTAYDSAQLPAGLNPSSGAEEGGAATVQKFSSSTEDFQNPMNVIYPFTVYVPGTYNIAEVSGNDINSIYLSNYTIGIDGTMYDLAGNITSTADGLTGNMKVYETGLTCDLTPGTHYLTFSITSERQRDGANAGAYAFLDHIDLELEEEPELNLEIADEYVEKGGSTYVTLTSVNPRTGAVVDEVYESETYSSSDTSVATVEQDGTVTAVGPGKAAIIADVVRQNGEEERVSVDIKVTVNALYCEVDGFTLDGEALTELTGGTHSVGAKVNIQNNELFPGKATIVFAVYAGNTLKGIEVVSDNAVEGFYTTPYELTLDNFDMDGVTQLSVMVWNDIGDLQPIAQKTSFAD